MQENFTNSFWCRCRDSQTEYSLYRMSFLLVRSADMVLSVSADCRYNLYLDGKFLGRGPRRSDLEHYFYENYRTKVSAGKHVLAVEVLEWHDRMNCPWSEIHYSGAFLAAGACGENDLSTPGNRTPEGRYQDVPGRDWFSQHTNIWAVLSGAVPHEEEKALTEKILHDKRFSPCSLYFQFYLLELLRKQQNREAFRSVLSHWESVLEQGFTTFPELPSPGTRSDCHAWSAGPCYHLLKYQQTKNQGDGMIKT